MDAYRTETYAQHGNTYRIEWFYDSDFGAPWENCDGHGPVSEWECRRKRPGELILTQDGRYTRFYDFQAAVKRARREQWGMGISGADFVEAARRDFEYLRRWCNDQWHYCGIVVTLLDERGDETLISSSLWGVEDEGYLTDGYHASVIQDLIGECEHQLNRMTYPVTACGV